MANVFDLFDLAQAAGMPRPEGDALDAVERNMEETRAELDAGAETGRILAHAMSTHAGRIYETHSARSKSVLGNAEALIEALRAAQTEGKLLTDWADYLRDAAERGCLPPTRCASAATISSPMRRPTARRS